MRLRQHPLPTRLDRLPEYTVHSVVVGYRLTLTGVRAVESMPYHRDEALPRYSVRVSVAGDELVVRVEEWAGRERELEEHLRAWILARVQLRGVKLHRGVRRRDPAWMEVWRAANPHR